MTTPNPDNLGPRDYDAELDAILESGMAGILAKLQARLEPQAALADLQNRVRGQVPPPNQSDQQASSAADEADTSRATSQALQAVCDRIDAFDFYLRTVLRSPDDFFAGAAFIANARPALLQLRSGLANRSLTKSQAQRILDEIQQNLDQADRVMRQQGSDLDAALRDRARGQTASNGTASAQMHSLHTHVMRLFEGSGHHAALQPSR
ncbi:hypothetical protein [Actinomadura fibrosa]|uniref:Uncharacterized protein n=1 Tax=Actinomadura fibrosa TaxID=111802 RepID=A0ABW2XDQ6_9ACTN|nr:hypothetical protein [Actinomadura fibrosa]